MVTDKSDTAGRLYSQKVIAVLIILGFYFSTVNTSYAHHSFAVHFVADNLISVSGTVTQFRFANPHGVIFFTVIDEYGKEQK